MTIHPTFSDLCTTFAPPFQYLFSTFSVAGIATKRLKTKELHRNLFRNWGMQIYGENQQEKQKRFERAKQK